MTGKPRTDFQNNYIDDTLTSKRGATLGDIQIMTPPKEATSQFSLSSDEYRSSTNDVRPPPILVNGNAPSEENNLTVPAAPTNAEYASVNKKKKKDPEERSGRSDRGERSGRSDRGERSGRSDRGERSKRSDRSERSERSDRSGRSGKKREHRSRSHSSKRKEELGESSNSNNWNDPNDSQAIVNQSYDNVEYC